MYKLLSTLLLGEDCKLNECQNRVILTNTILRCNRVFDSYKQCYKYLKLIHYLFK